MVLTWFDTVMGCFEPDQKSFWNDTWSVVIPACLDSRNTYVGEFISPEKYASIQTGTLDNDPLNNSKCCLFLTF